MLLMRHPKAESREDSPYHPSEGGEGKEPHQYPAEFLSDEHLRGIR